MLLCTSMVIPWKKFQRCQIEATCSLLFVVYCQVWTCWTCVMLLGGAMCYHENLRSLVMFLWKFCRSSPWLKIYLMTFFIFEKVLPDYSLCRHCNPNSTFWRLLKFWLFSLWKKQHERYIFRRILGFGIFRLNQFLQIISFQIKQNIRKQLN